MKLAFYKGKKRLFNKLVSWWTRGPYSHCELLFSDGTSASSSFIDGGVRYKRILYNDSNWDFIELGPQFNEAQARLWFDSHLGCKYDVVGLVGFVFRRVADDRNKYFCNESILNALGFYDAWRFDPNSTYFLVKGAK